MKNIELHREAIKALYNESWKDRAFKKGDAVPEVLEEAMLREWNATHFEGASWVFDCDVRCELQGEKIVFLNTEGGDITLLAV